MSFGVVLTRALTEVENTPHEGHAAAVASSVAISTSRVPSSIPDTRVTCTPGSPNSTAVLSITPLVLPTSECFATSRLQEAKGIQLVDALNAVRFRVARSRSKSRESGISRSHDPELAIFAATTDPRWRRQRPNTVCRVLHYSYGVAHAACVSYTLSIGNAPAPTWTGGWSTRRAVKPPDAGGTCRTGHCELWPQAALPSCHAHANT